jgi:hypothetical protein
MGIEAAARARTELHRGKAKQRILSPKHDLVGLAGEREFARVFDLQVDLSARPGGDTGIDFMVGRWGIDVKTARKPYYLLREVGKWFPDILVLASYDDKTGEARLIGWEWDCEMRRRRTKDFGGGFQSHFKPAFGLRSIARLQRGLAWEKLHYDENGHKVEGDDLDGT